MSDYESAWHQFALYDDGERLKLAMSESVADEKGTTVAVGEYQPESRAIRMRYPELVATAELRLEDCIRLLKDLRRFRAEFPVSANGTWAHLTEVERRILVYISRVFGAQGWSEADRELQRMGHP